MFQIVGIKMELKKKKKVDAMRTKMVRDHRKRMCAATQKITKEFFFLLKNMLRFTERILLLVASYLDSPWCAAPSIIP